MIPSGGRFITFEGGEGTGKSTQVAQLARYLTENGKQVEQTREPGGSTGAEDIRALLVSGDPDRWSPLSETLLFYAAREDHLNTVIRPALTQGRWVICDRFSDSTRAYQGAGGGVERTFIDLLDARVVGADVPDLTFVMDIDPRIGLERAGRRNAMSDAEDRFENKGGGFHDTLRQEFLLIAENNPDRCVVIDASLSVEDIAAEIQKCLEDRFGPLKT